MKTHPPRWADRFLEWYCHPALLEDIQGDAYELFYRKSRENKRVAKLQFVWNVMRFFRWKNIRPAQRNITSTPSLAMLKSYLITGMRSIFRNLTASSINIIGLSIALACGVTVFLLLDSYYHRDTFHEKGDRLYMVMNQMKSGDRLENWARAPFLLGSSVRDEQSAVESMVRIQRDHLSVRHQEKVFNESVWFVDPDFFNVFTYKLASGPTNVLHDKNNIVITEDLAIKFFGKTDVIGEELSVRITKQDKVVFKVGAVMERIPDNSSMFVNILIPMENYVDYIQPKHEFHWRKWADATFVTLKAGHQPSDLNKGFDRYMKIQNEANDKFQMQSVEMIPMKDVALRSYDIVDSLSWSNVPEAMIILGAIAGLLVLLACFNYMNVAVASVSTRLKEIGIRKVVGSGKRQIIQQFMIENLLLCTIAIILGTALAYTLLLPAFNAMYPVHVPFRFSSNGMLLGFFAVTILAVAIISGAYPAIYVASFNAVKILKGKEKFGSKSFLSKSLLTFQFVLSFTTIVAGLVFVNSSEYWENKDWGYDHDQHFFVSVNGSQQFNALKDKVATQKHILAYAGAESHIGHADHTTTVNIGDEQLKVHRLEIGFDYLETMNVKLLRGRMFERDIASDHKESVIINEAFAKKMNWIDPLNKTFDFDNIKWYVVGVVEDFYYTEFYTEIQPTMIHIGPEEKFRYMVVKAEAGHINEVSEFLKNTWPSVSADHPYQGFVQNSVLDRFFAANRSNNMIMYFLASVAFLLACMGLYGLVSYNIARRIKEYSLRKVFGANLIHIFGLMNRDYIWIMIISLFIGAPLGFYMMDIMMRAAYPEEIPINIWPFIITLLAIVATVVLTVSSQLRRVARENPTSTLKSE
jgi:putative ABC transport system permease protein